MTLEQQAYILEGQGLTMEFAGFQAVSAVDLKVAEGSIHALIGPNGAGKTTCFNMLTKFLTPTKGRIIFDGTDITRKAPTDVARLGLVRSFQISAVFSDLSVVQNVCVALQSIQGRIFQLLSSDIKLADLKEQAVRLLEQVGLQDYQNTKAGLLSYGRKRALELATTLALDPKVMLLDEPMAGMSPEDIERVKALILSIRTGRTILMVEHNLPVVSELCDRITVLARGQVLAEGDYDSVSRNPDVQTAYIGSEHD